MTRNRRSGPGSIDLPPEDEAVVRISTHRSGILADAELAARIKADLISELGAHDVGVDSSNGVVTLHGSVPYDEFRKPAIEIAQRQGARQVVDELKVDTSVCLI
jgi:osmotically-inducible protein OsmY